MHAIDCMCDILGNVRQASNKPIPSHNTRPKPGRSRQAPADNCCAASSKGFAECFAIIKAFGLRRSICVSCSYQAFLSCLRQHYRCRLERQDRRGKLHSEVWMKIYVGGELCRLPAKHVASLCCLSCPLWCMYVLAARHIHGVQPALCKMMVMVVNISVPCAAGLSRHQHVVQG
jgi:hypothetical protein